MDSQGSHFFRESCATRSCVHDGVMQLMGVDEMGKLHQQVACKDHLRWRELDPADVIKARNIEIEHVLKKKVFARLPRASAWQRT